MDNGKDSLTGIPLSFMEIPAKFFRKDFLWLRVLIVLFLGSP